jgi:hypothetical protein
MIASDVVVPVGEFLPLRLGDALNVDNCQGCGCDRIVFGNLAAAHSNYHNGQDKNLLYEALDHIDCDIVYS